MGRLGVIHRKGGQRNIWWFEAIFRLWWAQSTPMGSQWFPMDTLVWYENLRFYYVMISQWENRVSLIWKLDKVISDDLMHFLAVFRLWGAPKDPWCSPMSSNGQPSVPWDVEIKYSTMVWFHYGNAELYLTREVDKGIFNGGIFLLFSGNEGPPKGPLGSPMVLNGQISVPWKVEIKYSTKGWFHNGNTERYSLERWTRGYLMIWGVLFAIFSHWSAP